MFCPECGNSIPDTAKFCSRCGHKFETIEKSEKKYVRFLKKKKIVIPLLRCCILLLVYFSLFHSSEKETKSEAVIPQTVREEEKPEEIPGIVRFQVDAR